VAAAMIALLDQHIGELRQLLWEECLDQNTIILVTSDHGASFEGELDSCGSRRGQKRAYEGGIRVPLIVHCPDRIWFDRMMARQVSDHPCYTLHRNKVSVFKGLKTGSKSRVEFLFVAGVGLTQAN